MLPASNREAVFMTLGSQLLNPFFVGIMLSAVLAAIMSSVDSQLLVASSAVIRDIYDRILSKGKQLSQDQMVLYSRVTTAIIMLIAVFLAFQATDFVFWMVLFAWGGLGACFGSALLLAFFWKGLTKQGTFWGMISGLITVILVKQQPQWTFAFLPNVKNLVAKLLNGITYEAVPGFIVAVAVMVIVSLFTKKPENIEQIMEEISAD
jgi:Na+/proline symporter